SSCRRCATGTRPACSWRRTPGPAAAGRSAATAWCGSWPRATCSSCRRCATGTRPACSWRRTPGPAAAGRSAATA
ncbi:hypothetical protein C7E25_24500, partial [Stenotrophomonas maltophilia]